VISDYHLSQPLEATDAFRAPVNYTPPWMACLRSAAPDDPRRITYSVFFGKNKAFTNAKYSAVLDPCASQTYHPVP
jgi:hypothetical protein